MNRTLLIIVAAIVVVAVGAFWYVGKNKSSQTEINTTTNSTQTQNQTNTTSSAKTEKNAVNIQGFAFGPDTITVKVGDSITWTNNDSAQHSATADDGSFDTGTFGQGESKTVTFDKAGTFKYHCSVHPNMKATVIVE